jgi:hypothetical protein
MVVTTLRPPHQHMSMSLYLTLFAQTSKARVFPHENGQKLRKNRENI